MYLYVITYQYINNDKTMMNIRTNDIDLALDTYHNLDDNKHIKILYINHDLMEAIINKEG